MHVVHLKPIKVHSGAHIHTAAQGGPQATADGDALREAAACRKPMLKQAPGRGCSPWRQAHAGPRVLAGSVACGGPMLEYSITEGLHPVQETHTGTVLEELQPVGRTDFEDLHKGLYPVGGTPC